MADQSDARLEVVIGARLDRLEEKLNSAVRAVYGAGGKIQKKIDEVDTAWSKMLGKTDPAKALDKVFDSTRFRVLDSGSAKIGLFGSALESLGPAGLAAAAGVGALAAALAQAKKALEFADEISDTASKVGVGTDALQEYRYAVHAMGGDAHDADAALKGFMEAFGAAKSELSPRAMKPFAALGFTKEQLRSFGSAEDALRAVIDRISQLSDEEERQAVAAKLGLTPMLPLLRQNAEATDALREAAHRLGYVMDEEVIARAGEANDKLEDLHQVLSVQLATVFVELAPLILKFAEAMATAAKAVAHFAMDPAVQRSVSLLAGLAGALATGGPGKAGKWVADHLGEINDTRRLFGVDWSKFESPDRSFNAGSSAGTGWHLRPQGGAGAAHAKGRAVRPKLPGTPLGDDYAISALNLDGSVVKPATQEELSRMAIFGSGAMPKAVKVDAEVELKPSLNDAWKAKYDEMREAVHGAWSDGIYAALNGDFWGFLKNRIFNALAEGLSDALTNMTMDFAKSGKPGASWVATIASVFGYAGGTSGAAPGWRMVGEHGPELMNVPGGATVLPAHALGAIAGIGGAAGGGGGPSIYADFRGAVVTEELFAKFTAYADRVGAQSALSGAQMGHAQTMQTLARRAADGLGRR